MDERHAHGCEGRRVPRPTRRGVLAWGGTLAAAALAGCGGEEPAPDPVALEADQDCDVCGMIIGDRPGPNAQIFYADNDPAGHDNPARFETTWEAFQFDFDRRDRGWSRTAFYVTDYSAVDYTLRGDDPRVISSHRRASSFAPAGEVTFVVDSAVHGSMGPDLIGFADGDDASAFRDDHGGTLATLDDVTPELISQLRA